MAKFESVENLKICLLRAEDANPDLPRALEELGAIVDDIAVYKTVAETEDPKGAGAAFWKTARIGSHSQAVGGGAFPRAIRSAEVVEKIPANETSVHRPGNQQNHPRLGNGTRAGGENAHNRRPDCRAVKGDLTHEHFPLVAVYCLKFSEWFCEHGTLV